MPRLKRKISSHQQSSHVNSSTRQIVAHPTSNKQSFLLPIIDAPHLNLYTKEIRNHMESPNQNLPSTFLSKQHQDNPLTQKKCKQKKWLRSNELLQKIQWDKPNGNKVDILKHMSPNSFWFWLYTEYFASSQILQQNFNKFVKQTLQKIDQIKFPIIKKLDHKINLSTTNILANRKKQFKNYTQHLLFQSQIQSNITRFNFIASANLKHINIDHLVNRPVSNVDIANNEYFISSIRVTLYDIFRSNYKSLIPKYEQSNEMKQKVEKIILNCLMEMKLQHVIAILNNSIKPIINPQNKSTIILNNSNLEYQNINRRNNHTQGLIGNLQPVQIQYLDYLRVKAKIEQDEKSKIGQISKIICQICSKKTETAINPLLICNICKISIHFNCLIQNNNIDIPNWTCDCCVTFGINQNNVKCGLCSLKGDFLIKSNILQKNQQFNVLNPNFNKKFRQQKRMKKTFQAIPEQQVIGEYIWMHFSCLMLIPQFKFQGCHANIDIDHLKRIDKSRFHQICDLCKKDNCGLVIKCCIESCKKYFHGSCAKNNQLQIKKSFNNSISQIYCNNHKPHEIQKMLQKRYKQSLNEITKFLERIKNPEEIIDNNKINRVYNKHKKLDEDYDDQVVLQQKKYSQDQQDYYFIHKFQRYISKNNQFILNFQRKQVQNYNLVNVQYIQQEMAIQQNLKIDDKHYIWNTFTYRNLTPSQLFHKYNSIKIKKPHIFNQLFQNLRSKTKIQMKKEKVIQKEIEYQNQQNNQIYCLCEKKYDQMNINSNMIECESCGEWYHLKCIGFIGTQKQAKQLQFRCHVCDSVNRQKNRRFFDPKIQIKYIDRRPKTDIKNYSALNKKSKEV